MKNITSKLKKLLVNKKLVLALVILGVLTPALTLTYAVVTSSRNTPYMDQWELVTKFREIDNGTFGLDDVWRQHNEHRLVFPESIMIAMAYVTKWNVRAEMLVCIVFALGIMSVLVLLLKKEKSVTKNKWIYTLTLMITSVFVFSLTQAENWLWGWQIQWYLACLSFLIMIWSLNREAITAKYQMIAGAMAFVSTYSLGNGQFAWLIGAFVLYIHSKKLRYWLFAAAASLIAYHINLQRTGLETPVTELILHPLKPILYLFVYIGRPISSNIYTACVAGFLGLLLFIAFIKFVYTMQRGNFKDRIKVLIVPISLASFALLSAAVTTVSRSSLGVGQATASRYTTVSNLFWLGLLISFLIATNYVKYKKTYYREIVVSNVLCLFLALVLAASISSKAMFSQQSLLMKTIQYCTNGVNPSDDCLRATYPHPDIVRDRVEYLKQRGWAGYSEARNTN